LYVDDHYPTSPAGLDSFAALNVMEHMHDLAMLGHTVIASIHQPRSAIWDMFDKARCAPLHSRPSGACVCAHAGRTCYGVPQRRHVLQRVGALASTCRGWQAYTGTHTDHTERWYAQT